MATSNDLNISQAGVVTFDGTATFFGRTLTAGTGITITNGNGVSGNPVIASNGANDLHVAKFIVSSEGTSGTGANFTTIAAAIAAAQGTGLNSTIFIMPGLTGTYTENFTLPANINLTAYNCDAETPNVTIIGKITCSDTGSRSISGIKLQTNGDFSLVISGTSATIVNLTDCFLSVFDHTLISFTTSNGSSSLYLKNCKGSINANATYWSVTGSGIIWIYECDLYYSTAGTATASTNSSATIYIFYSNLNFPISCSSTGRYLVFYSDIETGSATSVTTAGTGVSNFYTCIFMSGSASAISIGAGTTVNLNGNCSVSSSNTNAITGAGTLAYDHITYFNTSANINTTTQTINQSFSTIPRTATSTTPYTVLSTDYFIAIDASGGAKQVNLPNAPSLNQVFTVKDANGNAAANNITVTTPGGVVNIDGATTYVIAINYGSAQFVWNGVKYHVF